MAKSKTPKQDLSQLRQRIDEIDVQLHHLLNDRARCAQEVAHIKQANNKDNTVFYCPDREAEVLKKIMDRNQGPLRDEEVARLFREIMSACLALELSMKVAFLGPSGTFTEAAALKHFGHSIQTMPLASIDEVFREVESGAAYYGVVPVENSTEGVVNLTLDSFMRTSLKICGEVALRIHHHLLGKQQEINSIKQIYSHQQTYAQCRKWLTSHCHNAEWITVESNAAAAKYVMEKNDPTIAAVAGDMSAELYGLEKLAANIEDRPDNTTRFLILGHQDAQPSRHDKTSILVSTPNKTGSLYHLLEPFQNNNISLTRIETRPSLTSAWAYVFFIDFEGHREDNNVAAVLEEVARQSVELKVLGSYPSAVL